MQEIMGNTGNIMRHFKERELNSENYKNLDEVLSTLPQTNKMLVICAAEIEAVKSFLDYLATKTPQAKIELLIQKEIAQYLKDTNHIKLIEIKRHGKKSFKISPRGIWSIMNNGYQLAWLISDNLIDIQNNRAKLYMLLSGAPKMLFVNASYSVKEDDRKVFIRAIANIIGEKISSFGLSWLIGLPLYIGFYLTATFLKLRRKTLKL